MALLTASAEGILERSRKQARSKAKGAAVRVASEAELAGEREKKEEEEAILSTHPAAGSSRAEPASHHRRRRHLHINPSNPGSLCYARVALGGAITVAVPS